ncbi:MAG: sn-glycerol-3-phosphate ABC transporter ATP-binding protein UgpC [Clostridia bacterium]|nr:sn-glycerol-3-phosphate ABC transporter ATP-binding protein UgpC [Clostridia bacterium]
MASIKFKNVIKSFDDGKVTVIPDLSFEIKDKEFVVLVGPSGCGKSTTLRMIAGLEDVSGGELYIDDKKVNNIAPKDRDIAMVFQSYALYPHMSVYKNMAFALKLRKMPKKEIDEKVRWAASILNIEPYLDRRPGALSGGQRQRVALGRAMVRNPKVFLLDEPLSNLDAKLRTEMRSQITMLHKRLQTTFVYVTHDQTEAMTMADRIAVMDKGVIRQYDTPQKLYSEPADMFVAGFIGSPRMNFIDCTVIRKGKIFYVEFSGEMMRIPSAKAKNLASYENRRVILGIRPEHITEHTGGEIAEENCVITAKAEIAEMTGGEVNVYFDVGSRRCIARIRTDRKIASGETVRLLFDCNTAHFFDKDTSKAIGTV